MQLLYSLQQTISEPVNEVPAEGIEGAVINAVQWLKLGVETIGALIIGLGVVIAVYYFIRALIPPQMHSYNKVRLILARYLALALEFQLGADILSTAIAPSWDQIGKLGAIAVIRTMLNYFLTREMAEEREATGEADDRSLTPEPAKAK
ncbi:DUF1622 domain-containing protein [Pontibacter oryzae]|uniref:DUF1622 domain-containing protein n=1 Tax=Pontibacter oryzae TaxID=2304593 RepID=A0A399SGZ9_9BACT|nr:DUF1622 domain-containing protein [Pontibacter oryzae]RIJ42371.1 DUF1622 domain-containing protein [Pontibacter oryzae]